MLLTRNKSTEKYISRSCQKGSFIYMFPQFSEEIDGEIDKDEPMSMLDDEESDEAIMEKMDHTSPEHGHDSSLMLRNGHISLFGEIIHDTESSPSDALHPPPILESTHEKVCKYLFQGSTIFCGAI